MVKNRFYVKNKKEKERKKHYGYGGITGKALGTY